MGEEAARASLRGARRRARRQLGSRQLDAGEADRRDRLLTRLEGDAGRGGRKHLDRPRRTRPCEELEQLVVPRIVREVSHADAAGRLHAISRQGARRFVLLLLLLLAKRIRREILVVVVVIFVLVEQLRGRRHSSGDLNGRRLRRPWRGRDVVVVVERSLPRRLLLWLGLALSSVEHECLAPRQAPKATRKKEFTRAQKRI